MAITVSMGLLDHFKRLLEYFPSICPHPQLASMYCPHLKHNITACLSDVQSIDIEPAILDQIININGTGKIFLTVWTLLYIHSLCISELCSGSDPLTGDNRCSAGGGTVAQGWGDTAGMGELDLQIVDRQICRQQIQCGQLDTRTDRGWPGPGQDRCRVSQVTDRGGRLQT